MIDTVHRFIQIRRSRKTMKTRKPGYGREKADPRISRALLYIRENLDEELSLGKIGDMSGMSRFHFHRLFLSCTGITLNRFIQQARLKRASLQLVFNKPNRVIDIALQVGFEHPESFSRAFKQLYGQAPYTFRRQPDWEKWWLVQYSSNQQCQRTKNMQVEIIDFPETTVAAIEHKGPEHLTYKSSMKFIQWRQENGVRPDNGKTFGIHYTDPRNTFPEDYRMDICVSVNSPIRENPHGVINKVIPACRCAVTRHVGSRDNVTAAEYLVYEWLPDSGEMLGDFPIFFHYVNVGPDVREHEMITDVYLPLK